MVNKLKRLILIITLFAVIIAAFHLKLNPKLTVFSEEYQSNDISKFDVELTSLLINKLNQLEIPGMQVAIKINDELHHYNIGTIDYKRTKKVSEENIYKIGSVTKVFTATLALKLIEEGYFDLEDTIVKWFPNVVNSETITIRTLLNHTSGIYNYTENFPFQCKVLLSPKKVWTRKELYKYIVKGQPAFKPGEEHRYSNSNYVLLGLICEKVTGKEYEELLHEKIIDYANLENTHIIPYDHIPEKLVEGYDRDVIPLGINKIKISNTSWSSMAYSAGAIVSNCNDLIKFFSYLLSESIISNKYLEEMMDFIDCTAEDIFVQTGYGLGLRRFEIRDNILIGHTGTIPGYGGLLIYNMERDYSVAVLANISYLDQIDILTEIINYINSQEVNFLKEDSYFCRDQSYVHFSFI